MELNRQEIICTNCVLCSQQKPKRISSKYKQHSTYIMSSGHKFCKRQTKLLGMHIEYYHHSIADLSPSRCGEVILSLGITSAGFIHFFFFLQNYNLMFNCLPICGEHQYRQALKLCFPRCLSCFLMLYFFIHGQHSLYY